MYIHPDFKKLTSPKSNIQSSPLDEVRNLIQNKQIRIADAGQPIPEPEDNLNPLLKVLDYLDRPGNAIRNALQDTFITKENSFLQGLAEGFTGKEKVYGSDLLEQLGLENKAGKFIGGLALDIALDPLTWLGGAGAKALASGFRNIGLNSAAEIAEKGLLRTALNPISEFNKGLIYAGLREGAGYAPVEDIGKGLAGYLGRKIGSLPVGDRNIGELKNITSDTIGQLFRPRHVATNYNPYGIEARSYEEGKKILEEGVNLLADTNFKVMEQGRRNIEAIAPVLSKVDDRMSQDIIKYIDAPITKLREKFSIEKKLPSNKRKYGIRAFAKVNSLLTKPVAFQDEFRKELTTLQELAQKPISSLTQDEIKKLKSLPVYEKANKLFNDIKQEIEQELLSIKAADPEYYQKLTETMNFLNERNAYLATVEGLTRSEILPNYLYHMFEGSPRDINRFFQRNAHLSRMLSPNIKAHKKRILATFDDLERVANSYKNTNKKIILDELKRVLPEEQYKRLFPDDTDLKNISLDYVKEVARNNGIDLRTLELEPEVNVVKDVFRLQVARELDSARNVVRTQLIKDLEENGLLKIYLDESQAQREIVNLRAKFAEGKITREELEEGIEEIRGRMKDFDAVLEHKWVPTDSIPGLPKGYAIHPELERAIRRLDTVLSNDTELQGLLRVWNSVQNAWKSTVTGMRPGWYINNLFGNVFNSYLGGLKNPNRYYYATQLQTGKNIDDVLKSMGIDMTSEEVMQSFRDLGLEGFGQMYGDISRTAKDIAREARGEVSTISKVTGLGRKLGDWMETNAKLALYLDQLAKGASPVDAARHVKKYLFDYTDLTKFERGLKYVMPFYTFTRKNLPLQLKTLIDRPDKYLAISRAQEETYSAFDVPDENIEAMPEWLRSRAFATPFENIFATPLLPLDTLQDFGTPTQAVETLVNMISPLLKVPVELAKNRSFFTDQPIERYAGETSNLLGLEVPAKLAYALEQLGSVRELNRATEEFITGKDYKGVTGAIPVADNQLLQGLSGMFTLPLARTYNPELAQLYSAYDYNALLEDLITALKAQGIPVRTVTEIRQDNKIPLLTSPIRLGR